jgi:hypothetical protein
MFTKITETYPQSLVSNQHTHSLPLAIFKVRFDITIPSTPRSSLRFSIKNFVCFSHIPIILSSLKNTENEIPQYVIFLIFWLFVLPYVYIFFSALCSQAVSICVLPSE